MKKKAYIFYYEEALKTWIPVPEKSDEMVDIDCFSTSEDEINTLKESEVCIVKFKLIYMTEKEFNNMDTL